MLLEVILVYKFFLLPTVTINTQINREIIMYIKMHICADVCIHTHACINTYITIKEVLMVFSNSEVALQQYLRCTPDFINFLLSNHLALNLCAKDTKKKCK